MVGVFPIHFSVPLPRSVGSLVAKTAVYLRICVPKESCCDLHPDLYKTRRSLQCIRKNDGDEVLGPSVRWHKTAIDFQTAPLIAVLLLLATGSLKGSDVRKGIVGTNEVEPLNIMALFVSLVNYYKAIVSSNINDSCLAHISRRRTWPFLLILRVCSASWPSGWFAKGDLPEDYYISTYTSSSSYLAYLSVM